MIQYLAQKAERDVQRLLLKSNMQACFSAGISHKQKEISEKL